MTSLRDPSIVSSAKWEPSLVANFAVVKMAASASRFASLGEEEMDEIIDQKDARSTKKVINTAVNVLKAYSEYKGFSISETIQQLNRETFFDHFMRRSVDQMVNCTVSVP